MSSLRLRAVFSSIRPEFRSASIAICLPGIASSLNRAATSETLSAPFVMTMNCTRTRMKNTTKPTTMFPERTKFPNVEITFPAEPPLVRISLVAETLSASRNSVATRSTEGKTENWSAFLIYMVSRSTTSDSVIFKISIMSSRKGGTGMMMRAMTRRTNRDATLFRNFNGSPPPFLSDKPTP